MSFYLRLILKQEEERAVSRTARSAPADHPDLAQRRRRSCSSPVFVFPVYWMFSTAFKPTGDIISEDPGLLLRRPDASSTSRTAVGADNFWTLVGNSLTGHRLRRGCSPWSSRCSRRFALARMRFKGRRGLILTFMIAQMAPWEVMVIAIYLIVRDADMLEQPRAAHRSSTW